MGRMLAADGTHQREEHLPPSCACVALWAAGLRYRIHHPTPGDERTWPWSRPGWPSFWTCFFHGCPHHYVRPRSRMDFWSAKLAENVQRDRRQTLNLEAAGWRVCRIWEHEVFESLEVVVQPRWPVGPRRRGRIRSGLSCDPGRADGGKRSPGTLDTGGSARPVLSAGDRKSAQHGQVEETG